MKSKILKSIMLVAGICAISISARSFCEPLFFHSKVKLFTRAIHFPQELKTNDGRLNTGEERQTAVIIMNERLEFVGDTIFNNGQYPIHSAIPLPDGLLLFSKDKDTKNTFPKRRYILRNLQ